MTMLGCLMAAAAAAQDASHRLVFDSYMTPNAGAEDLLTIQHAVAAIEDRWIPLTIGREETKPTALLGILYRAGKFLALDVPQDHLVLVAAHEVFGHGARFRELGDGRIEYGFDAPIPYGSGDAFTRFTGRFPISPLADLTASMSGIEAQHALASAIASRATSRGRLHYREAWLYFESRLTAMTYIHSASPQSEEGHDVANFLETLRDACRSPCVPLTRRKVQDRALFALADPMLFYAIYGFAGRYVGSGSATGPVPLIPLGRTRMMPSFGYALAPYGAEWTARVVMANGPGRIADASVRIGETGASTTWGVGARAVEVARVRDVGIDVAIDLWRQPDVLANQTSDPLKNGVQATATAVLPLPRWLPVPAANGLHLTAGYKTRGYVPGEQLSGGFVLRAGVRIR